MHNIRTFKLNEHLVDVNKVILPVNPFIVLFVCLFVFFILKGIL